MQLNNANNIILDDISNYKEYRIDKVIYNVNRVFGSKKTIKDILLEKLSSEKIPIKN